MIEGPDGSGKSTLVQKHFPEAIHNGGPPETAAELRDRMALIERGKVYDRWSAISEQVYGPAIRGAMLIPKREFTDIIRIVRPLVIYCRPPRQIIFENLKRQLIKPHKDKEFLHQVIRNASAIQNRYDELMIEVLPQHGCLVFTYDYSREIRL